MATTQQIIPFYAHPHVHTVINDDTYYDETVASPLDPDDLPFNTCAVCGADSGIDNTFVKLTSLKTKQAIFGRGNFSKYGQPSLQSDQLFNGSTAVWFCRVLPDNATYANVVVLAHYRSGKILDHLNQETGKIRMEVKFSVVSVDNAKTDEDIIDECELLTKDIPDAQTGYMTVPLFYMRSIGRGRYGNQYSLNLKRDAESEKEYDVKMYRYSLLSNDMMTRIINIFYGSMFQTTVNRVSTLIEDTLDQFPTGSCPVKVHTFESNFIKLYEFYQDDIVEKNEEYILGAGGSPEDIQNIRYARAMGNDVFDPIFGVRLNSRIGERIPFYRNYTTKSEGPWVEPNYTVPNVMGAQRPLNVSDWNTAFPGARLLMVSDPLNDNLRWLYTVIAIDMDTGNIVYDEGTEVDIDADQYDGANLALEIGHMFNGGHDGDFQIISVNGEARAPLPEEMNLLLSKEYVKVFRGEKDRKILSPARMNLDFIFDANYNILSETELMTDQYSSPLSSSGGVGLTDPSANQLSILGADGIVVDFQDLNVKKAMYELNEFRNKNGMTVDLAEGAGCLLHLDCNLTGIKNITNSYELLDIIERFQEFEGRNLSIDLGYFNIYDPTSSKKIKVTATYYLAKYLVPHIMRYGLNKPFVNNFATMEAISRNLRGNQAPGELIRDTFRPDIDLIDWDVKERLYLSRINYWLTSNEGRTVQRATQNTRQMDASCLLEENNVRVLNTLKKGLELACRRYLYEWNEPSVRRGYTEAQMDIYRPWIGTMVQDLEISFEANEWEQERMIMRCFVIVKFRDIVKRIILEINIQRPDYSGGE